MIPIIKKELLLFTKNKLGILTICILLFIYGLILFSNLFNLNVLEGGYANLDTFFKLSPIIFLLYIPAISMGSFSEELKNETIDILLSKPLSTLKLVLGKFFAVYFLIIISIIPTILYPITIYFLGEEVGNLDLGSIIGSYLGLLLLCSALVSISIFCSSMTKNQLNAYIFSVLLSLISFYGFDLFSQLFENGSISLIIQKIGMFHYYELLSKGLISFRDIVYFISITYLFILSSENIISKKL